MKEALFYEKLSNNKVRCVLCPHNCEISEGKRGICGVRENQNGKLISLVYGKIVSANIDPIEKKPLYNFMPKTKTYTVATVGCNFHCGFCQNYQISQSPRETGEIFGTEISPEAIVENAIMAQCPSISYSYTEPTIYYEFAYDTAVLAKAKDLKNIFITNGFISPEPLRTIVPLLDAANVDLKSFRDDFYRKTCGGKLAPVLETIKTLLKNKIWVELTTLIIPGMNDSKEELRAIANWIKTEAGADTPWHVTAFYPTYKMTNLPPTPPKSVFAAMEIGLEAGLKYVYTGNIPTAT